MFFLNLLDEINSDSKNSNVGNCAAGPVTLLLKFDSY